MLKFLRNQYKNLLDNGEFVDEQETEILQSSFMLMRFMHMMPGPGKNLESKDLILFFIVMFPFTLIGSVAEILDTYLNRDYLILNDLLQCLSVLSTGVNIYLTTGVFMYKNKDIQNLAQRIGTFRQFPKPLFFDRANRFANFITKFTTWYTVIGIMCFGFVSTLGKQACLQENIELKITRVCGLIAPAPFPEYFNNAPYLEVLVTLQLINCILVCVAAAVILTFICGLIIVIVTRIRHFKEQLKVAFDIKQRTKRVAYLKYCVRYHVHVIELIRDLNDCLSLACFFQAIITAGVIAMIAFQFLMKPELKAAVHGGGWFMVLAILCYAGQYLIDETSDIPEHIYNTNWYEYEVETQKFVLMIIYRSNHILFIDTIFLEPLGLTTFAAAMQNSYSVLAILYKD